MVRLCKMSKNTEEQSNVLQLGIYPDWYIKHRSPALELCGTGELPKQALITSGLSKSVVDNLYLERSDDSSKLILDELYAEVIRCITKLKSECHKFVLMSHDEHDLQTMKFLLEQDKRREALIDHIQHELSNDPYWNNDSNVSADIRYKIISF